jgi:ATP-dependent DNA ligase
MRGAYCSALPPQRLWLDRATARDRGSWARLLRATEAGILLNEHVAEDGPRVFAPACRLGAEGIVSKRIEAPIGPVRAQSGSRSGIWPASQRSENWNR